MKRMIPTPGAGSRPFVFSLCLALLLFLFAPARAQEEGLRWFGPDLGKARYSLSYQFSGYSEEEVGGQGKDFRLSDHRASLVLPVKRDSDSDASFSLTYHGQEIRTGAVLPDTGDPFPRSLRDLRLGGVYRSRFENGWIGGVSAAVGSASDRLFASDEELLLHATVFARIPDGETNAWLLFLNYSRTREFLQNVPLPGVGYWYEPSPRFRLAVGIPFVLLEARPVPDLSLSLSYFPVTSVRARASYRLSRGLRVYGGFEWRNESYFRADRREEKDRLTYYEKRVLAGVRVSPGGGVFLDFQAGYSFDRFYFEGQGYSDRDQNRLDISSGAFGAIRAGVQF